MAKASPRSNFLLLALWMVTIFMAFQLFTQARDTKVEFDGKTITTRQQAYQAIRQANLELKDQTLAHRLAPTYKGLVDKAREANEITPEQAEQLKLEAIVLVADAQMKAGIARGDNGRIRNAYNTLANTQKALQDDPKWTKVYQLPRWSGDDRFDYEGASGHSLYQKIVEELAERGRNELVWGFIPGGYQLIDFLVNITGARPEFSYAFAAFLLALVVRAVVYPLSQSQLMFGRQMGQLMPLINELKERYSKDGKVPPDKQNEFNVKVMELYREYGLNPAKSCLPMFLQLPLFLIVYNCMLLYHFEFQKGTFLWINPVMSKATNGFIAPNLGTIDYIMIVIYGVSMIVTTLLAPVTDPTQAKQMRMIGLFFAVFATVTMFFGLFPVPGAFVLYWTFTNILATLQTLWAYQLPLKPLVKVNAPGGGVFPVGGGGLFGSTLANPSNNGKGLNKQQVDFQNELKKTGTPAKHKPKKRK